MWFNPPNPAGGLYDRDFWDVKGRLNLRKVREVFNELGYVVPINDEPMNINGNNRIRGDEIKSDDVLEFQSDYSTVSRKNPIKMHMGMLILDGLMGPNTLNGLKFALDNTADGDEWKRFVMKSNMSEDTNLPDQTPADSLEEMIDNLPDETPSDESLEEMIDNLPDEGFSDLPAPDGFNDLPSVDDYPIS